MTLKDQMASDLSDVFFDTDDFADVAVYSPPTGSDVACSVVLEHNVELQSTGMESQVTVYTTVIESMISEVGIPAIGGTFTVSGTEYEIRELIDNDGMTSRVAVV